MDSNFKALAIKLVISFRLGDPGRMDVYEAFEGIHKSYFDFSCVWKNRSLSQFLVGLYIERSHRDYGLKYV
jgi:hypothetical protein